MFCPKCGTKNPDDGRFCRKCGTGLENVSEALSRSDSGGLVQNPLPPGKIGKKDTGAADPDELFGDSVKQIITGIGFAAAAIGLLITGAAGGKLWWWALLFPAFGLLSKGIADYLKSKRIEKRRLGFAAEERPALEDSPSGQADALAGTDDRDYLPPGSSSAAAADGAGEDRSFQTGDLVPPSVTENTTRHLELDSEGETRTLPKKETN